ncbi:MAG: glutamate 5-kinase [Vallitaleaceae bacterium]|jgi:glutamate 5-kinase|nr:glutamate 5-kinase [Vallitaleaceae bacterium]
MIDKATFDNKKRIIIKVGSSSLTHTTTGHISLSKLEQFVRQVADLKNSGREVIVVTSGAIAVGVSALHLDKRPIKLDDTQAVAAVGQASLMMLYQKLFREYNHVVGQVLITKDLIDHEERKQNAIRTFASLLNYNVIPIVNENDTVATEEIEFGDNDSLSAIVAELVRGDLLILLSDIDGLYDKNPKLHPDAVLIHEITTIDDSVFAMAGDTHSKIGTGGMVTKLLAGEVANKAGIDMIIANSVMPQVINRIFSGEQIGTYFKAKPLV